ncbi:MAG: hypothetical protein P857_100 [Candidatus Xenolissoclinum pacificiensis L6]|uniref:Uncharacterized protein n=1 Tax=Candidatus Xenolissoclinum pacificiensis L6 TaxID=1401685 RepID=W2UYS2_9RICK|nr:MAG: hypothetical protein P857_100 [Candidatus Xenolissoclinum pacificiensis L6]
MSTCDNFIYFGQIIYHILNFFSMFGSDGRSVSESNDLRCIIDIMFSRIS